MYILCSLMHAPKPQRTLCSKSEGKAIALCAVIQTLVWFHIPVMSNTPPPRPTCFLLHNNQEIIEKCTLSMFSIFLASVTQWKKNVGFFFLPHKLIIDLISQQCCWVCVNSQYLLMVNVWKSYLMVSKEEIHYECRK